MEQAGAALRFRHDRVQGAAHERLDAPQRSARSLALARRLATQAAFVNMAGAQYLSAIALVRDPDECRRAAHVFHEAAVNARRISDQFAAERFLVAALKLLEAQSAGADQSLHLTVSIQHHAALYGLGRLEEADAVYQSIEGRHPDLVELAGAACLQMASLTGRSRHCEALAMGSALLPRLGSMW
jgi:predicted ATPase